MGGRAADHKGQGASRRARRTARYRCIKQFDTPFARGLMHLACDFGGDG